MQTLTTKITKTDSTTPYIHQQQPFYGQFTGQPVLAGNPQLSTVAAVLSITALFRLGRRHHRVAHLKWYQLVFLLVTFECPDLLNSIIFAECNNNLLAHAAKHKSLILFVRGHQ